MADSTLAALGAASALDGTESVYLLQGGADKEGSTAQIKTYALASYAGASSITTVGTVATGTWSATAIGTTKGGTGLTSYTTGDLLYASASNVLSKLAAGTNGHYLKLDAGVPTWAAGGGGSGSPGGSDTQVQFNDSSAFGGDSGLTFNKTTNALTVGGATVTTSAPILNMTQTWNDSGVTFNALSLVVTNTASSSDSTLVDFRTSSNSAILQFSRTATLLVYGGQSVSLDGNNGRVSAVEILTGGQGAYIQNTELGMRASYQLTWYSSTTGYGTPDTSLGRNAAGVVEVTNGTPNTYRDILARGVRSNAVAFTNAIGSPVEGTIQAFTDSSSATWGATITGGGANHVLGYFNGTNWTVMAK